MGGKIFKDDNGKSLTTSMSRNDIEETLKYLSPIIGIPFYSKVDKKGNITESGLEDSTLGSSAKNKGGSFGKTEMVGDIDIVLDSKKYDFDKFVSRMVEKIGPENIGRTIGGSILPTSVPIAGNEQNGRVQVDFMFGNPDLMKFTYHSPDPTNESKFNGTYRNELTKSILQDMRRQVRDSESKEIIALVGPSYIMDRGIVQQWRHFPLNEKGDKRLKTIKPIGRQEFESLYPDYKGKEKDMIIDSADDIVNYIFPKSDASTSDFDSYEMLRDAVIRYKPQRAESVFNLFSQGLNRRKMNVPEGLIVETIAKIEATRVLKEVRDISLEMVSESIARKGKFEDFRQKCSGIIPTLEQVDHFTKPNATADLMPNDGLNYLINKCGLTNDWKNINEKDYNSNYHYRVNDLRTFYCDLCELMNENDFFFVTEHYGLKITPESFLNSLVSMNLLEE